MKLTNNWCIHCKTEITKEEDFAFYKSKFYHLSCLFEILNIVLEIDFEEETNLDRKKTEELDE